MEGYYKFDGVTDKGNSSYKFWDLTRIDDDLYEASWGKVGAKALGFKDYTFVEAVKVVHQKLKKGYELVDPSEVADYVGRFGS